MYCEVQLSWILCYSWVYGYKECHDIEWNHNLIFYYLCFSGGTIPSISKRKSGELIEYLGPLWDVRGFFVSSLDKLYVSVPGDDTIGRTGMSDLCILGWKKKHGTLLFMCYCSSFVIWSFIVKSLKVPLIRLSSFCTGVVLTVM